MLCTMFILVSSKCWFRKNGSCMCLKTAAWLFQCQICSITAICCLCLFVNEEKFHIKWSLIHNLISFVTFLSSEPIQYPQFLHKAKIIWHHDEHCSGNSEKESSSISLISSSFLACAPDILLLIKCWSSKTHTGSSGCVLLSLHFGGWRAWY